MYRLRILCLAFVLCCGWQILPARGQAWLTDQSYRPSHAPTESGEFEAGPFLPEPIPYDPEPYDPEPYDLEVGLLEPPPPMGSLPASVFDSPQAREEVRSPTGPVWYYPWTWVPRDGWKNSAELGINGSAGNAESMSLQAGTRFKRKSDFSGFDFRLTHNRTHARGIETQNNALLYTDFERYLGETPWTFFVKNGLEYDEFKAFDLRYNINSGFGYRFVDGEDLTLTGRFGAGSSREFGGPDNRWVPEALFGGDYEHQVNDRNKLIAKFDYFPEWGQFNNFRLVSDLAWEYLLDTDGNLSFKLGATDRYDSTPNGVKPNDVNYSALILYKF